MPSDLFKEKFLKGDFFSGNTTVQEIGKKLVKKRTEHLQKSRTEVLHKEKTKAISKCLEQLRRRVDMLIEIDWDPSISEKEERIYLGESFNRLGRVYDEATVCHLVQSVGKSVQDLMRANGLSGVTVEAEYKYTHACIVVRGIVKSFMDNAEDDTPVPQPPAPVEPRTGLKGDCCICLEKDQKLLTFSPCGHTACIECSDEFLGKQCPTCRQDVFGAQGVFPS